VDVVANTAASRVFYAQVDNVFKASLLEIQKLYARYAGCLDVKRSSNAKPASVMSLPEFMLLTVDVGLCRQEGGHDDGAANGNTSTHADGDATLDGEAGTASLVASDAPAAVALGLPDALPERIIKGAFVHSIQPVVNQQTTHRFQQVCFMEFLEAVRRCMLVVSCCGVLCLLHNDLGHSTDRAHCRIFV